MDKRISIAVLADAVLAQEERESIVSIAKNSLMLQGMPEEKAYRRIAAYAKANDMTLEEAARIIAERSGEA